MLEKVFIFIIFLGPLVFFHELGHFLFARLFGVRVETFSIGFGPKIFKYKKGDTEYAISLIPLGGYVKMFGDDPFSPDSIPEDQRKMSFIHKNKWQRFWIVFGGPLANFIFAYILFFFLLTSGGKVPEIKLGHIPIQSNFYQYGLRTGDVIKAVNEEYISSPTDIALSTKDMIKTITVKRNFKEETISIYKNTELFFQEMAKHPPMLSLPIVKAQDGKFYGLSTQKDSINWELSFEELNAKTHPEIFLHPLLHLTPEQEVKVNKKLKVKTFILMGNLEIELFKANLFKLDLIVQGISMNTPADKAGIKIGDIITSINNKKITNFQKLKNTIQNSSSPQIQIKIIRNKRTIPLTLSPILKEINGKEVKIIGIHSSGRYIKTKYTNLKPLSFVAAIKKSFFKTYDTIIKTLEGFKNLVSSKTSFKNLGGPLAIGKVASDSFNTSYTYFFQLMALISINLGVINLFPIPVLDGGHILFIILEIFNKGPLSQRKLEIAQQFGISFLLLLMAGAIFNDFMRFL